MECSICHKCVAPFNTRKKTRLDANANASSDQSMILKTDCNHLICTPCLLNLWNDLLDDGDDHTFQCPTCRQDNSMFTISKTNGERLIELPEDNINNLIYSQAYSQFEKNDVMGRAFYHFHSVRRIERTNVIDDGLHDEGDEASYISFLRVRGLAFDDGTAIPLKKFFTNCSYTAAPQREFRGTIDWNDKTVDGAQWWVFRMRFDENFIFIDSGECKSYDGQGNLLKTDEFVGSEDLIVPNDEDGENASYLYFKMDATHTIRNIFRPIKESNELCAICFKKMVPDDNIGDRRQENNSTCAKIVKTHECNHKFCLSCMIPWLTLEARRVMQWGPLEKIACYDVCDCPLCNQAIDIFSLVVIDNAASIGSQQREMELLPRPTTIDNLIFSDENGSPFSEMDGSFHFHLPKENCSQAQQRQSYRWFDTCDRENTFKNFMDWSYDVEKSEFRGSIYWDHDHNVWNVAKEVYRMKFTPSDNATSGAETDTSFMFIHSGEILMYDSDDNLVNTRKLGEVGESMSSFILDICAMLKRRYPEEANVEDDQD